MADEMVSILLKFLSNTEQAQGDLRDLDKEFEQVKSSADKLQERFDTLGQVSAQMAAAGAVIFAPAILSAQNYIEAVGKTEVVSKRYLAAQERQSAATVAFGRKAAEALIPYQEALAKVLEMASRVDPRVIEAGLALGGGLVLMGAIGTLTAQIGIFTAQSTKLIASLNANFAGGGLTSRLAVGAGAVALGTGIGIAGVRAYGEASGDERLANFSGQEALESLKQLLFIAVTGWIDILKEAASNAVLITDGISQLALILDKEGIKLGADLAQLATYIEEGAANLAAAFKLVILNVEKAIAGIKIETKLGDIDLGKQSGLDVDQINKDIEGVINGLDDYGKKREAISKREAAALGSVDEKAQGLHERLTDLKETIDSIDTAPIKKAAADVIFGKPVEGVRTTDASAFSQESLDLFAQYRADQSEAEKAFYDQRRDRQKQFNTDSDRLETDFRRKRRDSLTAFNKAQGQAEAEFYKDRAARSADFHKEDLERQADFARERQRAEEDHRRNLIEAAGRLDAIAVLRELQTHKTNEDRTKEDFGDETERRRQQFEESRQLDEQNFRARQAQERQRFDEQRSQELEQHNRQMVERRQAFAAQLRDEQSAYNAQKRARSAAFRDQLDQLNQWGKYEVTTRQKYYAQLQKDLAAFLGRSTQLVVEGTRVKPASPTQRGPRQIMQYADGGYTGEGGLAMTHPGEFVLNQPLTHAMERFAGAPLNEQKIAQAIDNSHHRTMGNVSITNQFGDIGQYSPEQIGRMVDSRFRKILEELS